MMENENLLIYKITYISIVFAFLTLLPFHINELKKRNKRKRKKRNQNIFIAFKNYIKKIYNHMKKDLMDNVFANYVASPYIFLIGIFFLNKYYNIELLDINHPFDYTKSAISASALFTWIYLYASQYFQPDLDIRSSKSRPGMKHFPLGYVVGYWGWGRFLKWFLTPIRLVWVKIWDFFSFFTTHRGWTHYPVISVWIRVAYLWALIKLILLFCQLILFDNIEILLDIKTWLESFFPWSENFGNLDFFILNFSIYMSDFIHFIVDYFDSAKRGLTFCPPKIPRGFWARNFKNIKTIITGKEKR